MKYVISLLSISYSVGFLSGSLRFTNYLLADRHLPKYIILLETF